MKTICKRRNKEEKEKREKRLDTHRPSHGRNLNWDVCGAANMGQKYVQNAKKAIRIRGFTLAFPACISMTLHRSYWSHHILRFEPG